MLGDVYKFCERDFAVEVFVCLDDGPVHKLLQLHVVQVVAHHHLEHSEELAVRNEAVVVDVVDLKREPQLLFLRGGRRERVETLHKLEERNVSVLVLVEHRDHALDQGVLREL